MKFAHLALLAGLCSACGTATDTSTSTTGGARGSTSVGRPASTTGSTSTTGGTATAGSTSGTTTTGGTATSGTTTRSTTGGTATAGSSSTTGGTATAGSSSSTTGGAATAGGSSSSSTGGSTSAGGALTYKLHVQVLGGAPGSVTVQNEAPQTLTFTGDGNQSFSKSYNANDTFTVASATATHAHRACTWSADANQFSNADINVTVRCVWQAVRVLGQADFVSNAPNQVAGGAVGANTMSSPTGNPVVGNGNVLFIADTSNHRILGYTSTPSASNANATFQIGQSDFGGGNPHDATNLNAFHAPSAIASNGARFAVADTDNDRILLYTTQPQQTGNANFMLRGPSDCSSHQPFRPTGVAWAGSNLIVADTSNARLFIYNTVPNDPNQAPDVYVGQAHAAQSNNDCTTLYPPKASDIYGPTGLWSDGTRLAVADTSDNRVSIWNTLPTQNNTAPNVVVGQPDSVTEGQGNNATGLTNPRAVLINGTRLFVADTGNHRVLYWNTVPTSTGVAADGVFGWASPVQSSIQCDDPSASTLCTPTGIAVYGGYIFIVDTDNHRVLMFADDLN